MWPGWQVGRVDGRMDEERIGLDEEEIEEEEIREERKWRTWVLRIVALLALVAFVSLCLAEQHLLWTVDFDFLSQDRTLSEDELVKRCEPAVVSIRAWKSAGQSSSGTGVNLAPEGVVVTNRHVVEGSRGITVSFGGGKSYPGQELEMVSHADLAVIHLQGKDLPFLPTSEAGEARPGQLVTVIGNPRGFQRVPARGQVGGYYRLEEDGPLVFDIDVVIAPGSSGSPVLDDSGQVVGIVFATGRIKTEDKEEERALAIPVSALNLEPDEQ